MKKKHVIKSLSLKFFLLFVGILWASSTAALVIIVAAKWNASQSSVIADIMTKAEFFQKFYNENPADFSNLIEFMDDSDTKVSVFSGYQELKESAFYRNEITEEQYNRLMSGDTLKVEQFKKYRFMPFVGFRAGNKAVLIHPRVSLAGNFKGSALVLFICSCLGSIMTAIAAGLVVRPIKKLTAAAREVSKGNFNITVEPKSSDEIGQLTETFNVMTGELKNMEYLRKDFISSVSHEFKTPITAIQGFAKLIREKQLPREQFEEYADIIISETGRLSNLSTNLLQLSALENQAIHDKFAEFSLDEQIRRVILLLENKWSEKNIGFDLDLNETRYSGNEELMQQVWINLISNAVKFSDSGGTVRVSLQNENKTIKVKITNGGTVISKEDEGRVFDMFYKGDKSRSNDGNGLGLAIVKKIVELHNGRVYSQSSKETDTTFTVELNNNFLCPGPIS